MSKSSRRTPLYEQIEQYVLDKINQHKWKSGDKIPSENELADKFSVSRITVQKAFNELINQGLIYRIQGKGTFVSSSQSPRSGLDKLGNTNTTTGTSPTQKLIAFIIPEIKGSFGSDILAGVENVCTEHGYQVVLGQSKHSQEEESRLLKEMLKLGVEGVIIYPVDATTYSTDILQLTLNRFPLVLVDRYLRGVDTNCVLNDNAQGATEAIEHLVSLGHEHIGFVSTSSQGTTSIEDRIEGTEQALLQHNMSLNPLNICAQLPVDHTKEIYTLGKANEQAKALVITFLKERPNLTAIIASNDYVGLTVLDAAQELGLHVPNDISLLFYRDYEHANFSHVPPTCIQQQEVQLGQEAGKLLLSTIDNPDHEYQKILVPTILQIRTSTAKATSVPLTSD